MSPVTDLFDQKGTRLILHYYRSPAGNFGDDLNLWLWPRLLPDAWDPDDGIRFAGIGTIITTDMPRTGAWIVLGSGAGYGPPPPGFGGPTWRIMSVRGPLSAQVLGLPRETAVTDGALLLNSLPEYRPLPDSERTGIVFVPHHQALDSGAWDEVCRRAGIDFVDPRLDSKTVVSRLRRARIVIADSMHAAIIADALRVPWVPVATSLEINTFKWLDWTGSMNVAYRPTRLPASTVDEWVRSAALVLHGQRYFVAPPTLPAVLKHYDRTAMLKRQAWWPLGQRFGERIYFSGLKRVMRALHRTRLTHRSRDAWLDGAAEALRRVAAAGPFCLSDHTVWQRRNEQLRDQLAALPSIMRSLASKQAAE